MNWSDKITYKNHNGLFFDIQYTMEPVDDETEFYSFVVNIINKQLEEKSNYYTHKFRVIIKKTVAGTVEIARTYLSGLPLENIKSLLESATNSSVPFLPKMDSNDGYTIINDS